MIIFKKLAVLFCLLALFFSCLKTDRNTGCPYTPSTRVASQSEQDALATYLDTNDIEATKHSDGFYYVIGDPGTGTEPPGLCSQILINYKGMLTNETVFDEQSNVQFVLGSLIEGWKKAIPLLRKGGFIRLYLPPSLGYGNTDYRNNLGEIVIPANSIIIFDIKLQDYTIAE